MAFTFVQPRPLKPEQVNPFANLVSKALQGYGQGMKGAYLPQELQADIFAKRIGPLATLATSPMFLQNPQFQSALGNLIAKNLSYGGKEFEEMGKNNLPTYADQVNKDIEEAQNLAKDLTKGGKLKVGTSSVAGKAENYLGDIGKHIVNFFTGGAMTSDLAQKQNRYDNILTTLKNNAVQAGRLTQKDAEDIFAPRENETAESRLKRIKRTVPSLFEQEKTEERTNQGQMEKDNEDLRFALDLADQIYQKTGKIVSENLIFNYMQEHPGKIHIPSLLKAIGAS